MLHTLPAYAADATVNVSYEAVNIPDPVEVGQNITYKIKWSCASSTSDCDTFNLDYTLPSGFEFVNLSTPPAYSGSETGGVVNISTPTLSGGDSAEATLTVRAGYYEPANPNFPVQGTLNVTTDTNADTNETDPLSSVQLNAPTTQWDVTKVKTQPAGNTEPAVDNPIGYKLEYCSASSSGNVDITNAVLVDTFPAGAVVIDADGGTVDNGNNTITWNLGTLNYYPPNDCVTKRILLEYPTPTFATGDAIANQVNGSGDDGSGSVGPIGDDTVDSTLAVPVVDVTFGKSSEGQIVGPDALAEFTFSVDNSKSNVPADNFILEETIPIEMELTHIYSGRWVGSEEVSATVEFQDRGSTTWNVLGTVDFDDYATYSGTNVGGTHFGTNVGKVRWVFFTADGPGIPSGFVTSTSPRIWARPSTPIAAGTNSVNNCASANYTDPNDGSAQNVPDCGTVSITDTPIAVTDIDKKSNPTNDVAPTDQINYSIDLKLLAESSADWINPVVTDTLPAELTFISWDNVATDFGNGVPADTLPTFTTSTLPSGETLLRWEWTGANAWTVEESELARVAKTHTIKYTAQVREGVSPGSYDNNVSYSSDSPNGDCNGDATCSDTRTITVRDVGVLQSDKWVAGDPALNSVDIVANPNDTYVLHSPFDPTCPDDGSDMTRFPCIARSYPLENYPYRLEVTNAGNVDLRDYVLYDVLPHDGDTGISEVLQADPRGSTWQPLLTGPVIPSNLPAGITAGDLVIEYSDAFNSCRPEVSGSSNESGWQTGCVNDWTTTPDNWDDVKSFKIAFVDSTVKWPPQTSMTFSMTMLIPNTNVPGGSIAWNSIAHRATNDFSDSRLLTADPKKVGIAILYYDWGDLPDLDADGSASPAYDTDITTLGGPSHLVMPQLYLGAGVDAENNGQPNAGANGDDNGAGDYGFGTVPASGDDEDGVQFLTDVIMPNGPVEIEVSAFISGTPGVTATVGVWIDLNGDGDFTDSNEFTTRTLVNPTGTGTNITETISLVAPADVGETIYSRFRLAFDPDEVGQIDDATGSARSGEVEDYVLMSLGNQIWSDDGIGGGAPDNGVLDGSEQGIPGVVVELHDTVGTVLATTTTDINGNYLFTGLPEDDYVVHIAASNFSGAGPLVGLSSSSDSTAGVGDDPDSDADNNDDNGIDDATAATNGISSAPVTLAFGTEPTDDGNNSSSNLSVDFGFVQYDWGDLPDGNSSGSPDYNTTGGNGGPAHVIVPGLYMGSTVDPETNGQPSPIAAGDDTLTGSDIVDDEDGVSIPSLITGQPATVSVSAVNTTGQDAIVYGFIDFDGDGLFTTAGEIVTATVPDGTTSGSTNLTFNVPINAPTNISIGARFRLSTDGALGPDGPAPDGEIEDYLVQIAGYEYGDLPDQYGTIENGTVVTPAIHIITDQLNFGTEIDNEADGQPDINAGMGATGGDDNTGSPDDEDGIVFMTPMMAGTTAVISMTAHVDPAINGDGTAHYGAWIDLNGDGDFDDSGEYLTGSLGDGQTTLNVPIPAGTVVSDTIYSRFRISADESEVDDVTDHVGLANTGEVEDYVLMSLGNQVWLDNGIGGGVPDNGVIDGGEEGIAGVVVELHDNDGTVIATTTTDSMGNYLFTGLAADDYTVHIPAANFSGGGALVDLSSSTDSTAGVGDDPDTDADDHDDNGIDDIAAVTNGISSAPVTLAFGTEPTDDGNGDSSNLSVDFGFAFYDWGDLPDGNSSGSPDYNTAAANGGAAHVIIPGLYLGSSVDPETDGQPSATAMGDDTLSGNDSADDEDGITFPPIIAGQTATLSVSAVNTTGTDATIYGFIDFDGDGLFTGPGETVSATVPDGTTSGSTNLVFNVPLNSPINTTVGARFRLSTDGALGPDGPAPDGEVEDYLVQISGYEYGDLPDQYGTIENGTVVTPAIHIITDQLNFGAEIDHEGDGQPDVSAGMGAAGGDDNTDSPDDEDGIVFMTPMMAGTTAVISMTAHVDPAVNGDGTAYYGAWIDLNGDGDFDDSGEYLTGSLGDGQTTLNVPIPAGTVVSDTVYSRFRISADESEVDDVTDHVGLASSGEVEDYVLMSLGNRVFLDDGGTAATADDGAMTNDETGIDGVTVELYRAGDTPGVDGPIATTVTANGGGYLFTGLVADDYFVHLPTNNFATGQPLEGLTSSSDPTAGNVDPDGDPDDETADENGIDSGNPATMGISTQPITLAYGDEPTSDGNGVNSNLTVDFGLTYYDVALIKTRSMGQDYAANFGTNPPTASFDITVENQGPATVYNVTVLDSLPAGTSVQSFNGVITGTATVVDSGPVSPTHTFMVNQLAAGESVTFQVLLQLDDLSYGVYTNIAEVSSMENSGGTVVPDIDSSHDITPTNDLIDISPGIDPSGDDDDNSHNDLNFGNNETSAPNAIVHPIDSGDEDDHDQEVIVGGLALGNRVWYDGNNNGLLDAGEQGIEDVLVEVYAVDGSGNPMGAPFDSVTTDAAGYWLVDNIPPGDYVAVIPASNFNGGNPLADMTSSSDIASTADPENNQESDDNGIGEQVAGGPVTSGVITLDPLAGEPEQTNGEGDLNPTGHGNAGDFFDNLTIDFGFFEYDLADAPDSYNTLVASNGPRHILDGTTFLGSTVDPEVDGQPDNNAEGDDSLSGNDLTDDEDGITFLSPIMAGEPFTIEVEASVDGYLNSWIDFDGNGTFDLGEQLTTDQLLNAGTNSLVFTAPAMVDDDNLYSRFRFTADSGEATAPDGEAISGEVEDYVLMSLGDTVWLDNSLGGANNGVQDGTEAGISNVIVELYLLGATPGVDAPIATTTTDNNGQYLFTGLIPGDYSVYLPPSNFADGAPLEDHFSSSDPGGLAVDPDNDQDLDDNGAGDGYDDPRTNGIISSPATLALGTEPTDEGDGNQSNRSVDFGLVQYDKGDLPDSNVGEAPGDYETLTTLGHDGAMHVIVPDVYLGAGVDAEFDGQPHVDATGDDSADSDDEDGVVFTSQLIPGQDSTVDVTANVDGYLNAWIDFNGDGDFDDPGEQIAADTVLTAGTNNLTYPVPSVPLAQSLYTRFRFTSDDPAGQLGANGAWDNGEVEDYVLHGLSLGNQVWHDLDDDGIRDMAEPAIDGVLVNLIDPATGSVIMTDTTAAGGYYLFNNLLGEADHQAVSGDYIVEIPAINFQPGGPLEGMYNSTPTEADPNADIDINDNGINPPATTPQLPATSYPQLTSIQSGIVTLSDYDEPIHETDFGPDDHGNAADDFSNLTVDFGFYLPVTVGDRVWYDHDQDGIQDAVGDEPGVPGIDVILYDSITGQPVLDGAGNPLTTATDSNGDYLFEELPPGRYHVQFDLADLPQNYIVTAPHVGTNISVDSNANPSLGVTDSTPFLYSNAEDRTLDMGIMLLEDVRVGDRVWFDDNKDGIQDAGEAGVPGVTVTLYDAATGQPVLDENGAPLTDVTDVTDVGGNYLFDGLPPGDYYVNFDLNTLPQNYLVTTQDATSDQTDSDVDPTTGNTPPTGMLNSTEQDLSLDMGIYRLDNVQVGDRVWYDDNRDGVQDAGETGVENVTVVLYDTATAMPVLDDMGNPQSDITDGSGNYLFEDLPPGDYYVQFDLNSLPLNYMPTLQDATSDQTDSDADPVTGATAPTGMLNSGEQDLSLDLGIHRNDNVQVGDRVWYDDDLDGQQDPGEDGVPNVGVTLYDAITGQPVTDGAGNPLTTVTDGDGNYLFTDLPPGDYYVTFDLNTLPPNQTPTTSNVGSEAGDSDANPLTGETASTGLLNSNDLNLDLDMGIHRQDNVEVGDRAWYDDNRDGVQDTGEAGVPNVMAILYDTATGQPVTDRFGVPLIDLTDANGDYLFSNLPPGDYFVEFQLSSLPTGYVVTQPNQGDDALDSDADAATGRTDPTGLLMANEADLTLDMGIYRPVGVRIGDRVWYDNNQDGIQDSNEPGVPDVTVTLLDSAGNPVTVDKDGNPIVPQTTDVNGNYLFENLPNGDYTVHFDLATLPADHVVTEPGQTNDQSPATSHQTDSDADPTTGMTDATGLLADGDEDLGLDMGIYSLSGVEVGDTVWYDNNGDGIQDDPADEPGVAGVTVNLFNTDGNMVTDLAGDPVGPMTTDSDGHYLFDNLPAGDYYVGFDPSTLPTGYVPTMANRGNDDSMDSDGIIDPAGLLLETDTTGFLPGGTADMSLDLGIIEQSGVRVGDRVWADENGDGIQDDPADEPGVAGMTVNLFNVDGTPVLDIEGNPVTPAVTDESGNYLFDNLPDGNYYVQLDPDTLPDGSIVTTLNPTEPTGDLVEGQSDLTLDIGIFSEATPTPTVTPAVTPTVTLTITPTVTPAATPTVTPVITPMVTPIVTPTPIPDPVTVGNRVWFDNDGDGVQDDPADEPGVKGVTVQLYNADGTLPTDMAGNLVDPQITDDDGYYLFEDLPEGDYYVEFALNTLPSGYVVTAQNAVDNDGVDSDGDPITGRTEDTGFLAGGDEYLTLDLGIVAPVSVGEQVWYDYDGDGLQGSQANEPGVPGVTVILLNADGTLVTDMFGNPVQPQVTDINGEYLFENLPPGNYQVMFDLDTLPPSHVVTQQDATNPQSPSTGDELDSDADPVTGQSSPTGMLLAGDNDLTLSMGILPVPEVKIGDRVWIDNNGNGIQDDPANEPGLSGVIVTLFNANGSPVIDLQGNPVTPVTTDSEGNYLFERLPEGNFYVQFELPPLPTDYTATIANVGDDDGLDSDVIPDPLSELLQSVETGFLAPGSVVDNLDMGLSPTLPVAVGDRVWYDNDRDGVQGDLVDEPGVAGVEVSLFNADGTPAMDMDGNLIGPAITNGNGEYLFENLPAGEYFAQFHLETLPENYVVTVPNTTDDRLDSDANPSTGETGTTGFIPSGSEMLTLDMGIVDLPPDVRIGDRVWLDENRDGIQNVGELGVGGVGVTLYDGSSGDVLDTTTTDSEGNYLFDMLPPGDYFVQFDLSTIPDNHAVTTPDATNDQSPANSDQFDSDANPEDGRTPATGILFTGEENLSLDMGLYQVDNVKVGDRVWYDLDGDGIQDDDEAGVENVSVRLFDRTAGLPVAGVPPQLTDNNGNYLFEGLPAGDYYVIFDLETLPNGYSVTEPNQSPTNSQSPEANDQLDSDASQADGRTSSTGFLSGQAEDLTLDMGIVKQPGITIGNYVWFDDDGDGIQDPAEDGVPGILVYLYDASTDQIVTDETGQPLLQVTDVAGEYLFEGVDSGQYYVQFDLDSLPNGYIVSPSDTEASDTADSDADPATGNTSPTAMLIHGSSDHSLDMGIYKTVALGDRVWFDDGNGQQDVGESGVPGVGITLYNTDTGEAVATTTTTEDGTYRFENVSPGSYFVEFDAATLPEGFVAIQTDSDGNTTLQLSSVVIYPSAGFLSSGEEDMGLDMGIVQPVEIGDLVWYDENQDGIQQPSETGVEGVTVKLYDSTGNEVQVTTTDSTGAYHFGNLPPGDYTVQFDLNTLPEGYVVSPPNATSDQSPATSNQVDSDANPDTGQTASTGFLPSGSVIDTLDMGIHMPTEELIRIGGQLWEDVDTDGEIDPEETLWSDIVVALYSQDAPTVPVATTITDEDGNYLFEDIPSGSYFVALLPDSVPEDALPPTYYGVGSADSQRANTGVLDEGTEALDLNIALNYPGSLSGTAWLDQNGDGIQATGETVLSDITVLLYDNTGEVVGEVQTDADGNYRFQGLMPSEYRVEFVTQDSYTLSDKLQGDDPTRDSDADPTTGQSGAIIVGSNKHVAHVDVGLYEGGSITNLIWVDIDGDNIQDEDEAGIPNITVFLFNEAGEIVAETMTDDQGRYGFSGLVPGNYYAAFAPPPDMVAVTQVLSQGSNLVRGPLATVEGSSNVSAIDIGFTQPAAIGNYVWLDTDKDGLADPGEMGIAGAVVHLLDAEGNVLASTTTDSDGHFEFLVAPGNYLLEFEQKDGMDFTIQNDGDDTIDSDVDPKTGRTALIAINANVSSISHFAGFIVSPTAIELIDFSATELFLDGPTGSGVMVEWITGVEMDTFGFDIYRSRDSSFGNAVKMTENIILASGGDAIYTFSDNTARVSQAYNYWLVEVQNDQVIYQYGPIGVIVEGAGSVGGGNVIFLPIIQK